MELKVRALYFDVMRISSVFFMMLLHVSARMWYTTQGFDWQVLNIYDCLVRFCVPVFFMISGSLFLQPTKTLEIKSIYTKYILRILTAFVFWSFFYAMVDIVKNINALDMSSWKNFLNQLINGRYHLWFLYVIAGIYISLPVLRKIAEDIKILRYFLIASFIFGVLIPTLQSLPVIGAQLKFVNSMNLQLFSGYTFYYLLGYYLNSLSLNKKAKIIIYILGVLGTITTIIGSASLSAYTGMNNATLYAYLTPNCAFQSIAVFVFFKEKFTRISFKYQTRKLLIKASKLSFGMYLVHDFFITALSHFGLNAVTFTPIIAVPLITIIVFICSYLASYIINKIPFLNKYII